MRKSRFLLNLIAATAIGLSVFGCDSSSTEAVQGVSDLTVGAGSNNGQIATERQNLREYMIVGERGIETFQPNYGNNQGDPADAATVVASPGAGVVDNRRAALWELLGVAERPTPNSNIVGPGTTSTTAPQVPTVGGSFSNQGTTGYHSVAIDPTGNFVVMISRGRNRGLTGDTGTLTGAQMQIFKIGPQDAFDQTFPPVFEFQATADPLPILVFNNTNQGAFVSGEWSPDARNYYCCIDGTIRAFGIDGTIGRLTLVDSKTFPAGTPPTGTVGSTINNAAQLLFTPDGSVMYAIDNGNNQIIPYARNASTGQLTAQAAVPTVVDPRGATIDRSGKFLYIVGRESGDLAGYSIGANGALTQIEVFANFGPIAVNLGSRLGDVDCSPINDQLFLSTYRGVTQGYSINPTTGLLNAVGASSNVLAGVRNVNNIEVEPTGAFILSSCEADREAPTSFFANIDSNANGTGQPVNVATPAAATDSVGRIVYAVTDSANLSFDGAVTISRINPDGSVRIERQVSATNPYGIDFFQRVITPPAGAATTTP